MANADDAKPGPAAGADFAAKIASTIDAYASVAAVQEKAAATDQDETPSIPYGLFQTPADAVNPAGRIIVSLGHVEAVLPIGAEFVAGGNLHYSNELPDFEEDPKARHSGVSVLIHRILGCPGVQRASSVRELATQIKTNDPTCLRLMGRSLSPKGKVSGFFEVTPAYTPEERVRVFNPDLINITEAAFQHYLGQVVPGRMLVADIFSWKDGAGRTFGHALVNPRLG